MYYFNGIYYTLDLSNSSVSEKEVIKLLSLPSDFGMDSDRLEYIGKDWTLGPGVVNRDSSLLEQSNWEALKATLNENSDFNDQHEINHCGHWACGWVDHLSFKVLNFNEETKVATLTPIFLFLEEWNEKMEDYPVADEDDLSRRELECCFDSIETEGRRFVLEPAPEGWVGEVYRLLPSSEVDDPEHTAPSEFEIKKALLNLGYLDVEEFPVNCGTCGEPLVYVAPDEEEPKDTLECSSDACDAAYYYDLYTEEMSKHE